MSIDKKPQTHEVLKSKEKTVQTPSLKELVLFAEFNAERFKQAGEIATNDRVRPSLQKNASDMTYIRQTLQRLAERRLKPDEALQKLMEEVRTSETLPPNPDMLMRIKNTRNVINFLVNNLTLDLGTQTDFQNWRQEKLTVQEKAFAERQATRNGLASAEVAPKIERAYEQIGIPSPTEREQLREKAVELVLRDGGVRVHMSIEQSLSTENSSGFQQLTTRINDGRQPSSARSSIESQLLSRNDVATRKNLNIILSDHGIREIIDIRHEKALIFEAVNIPGKKGIFGIGKTADRTEKQSTGRYEPIFHKDCVQGGKNEPAVRFTYLIPHNEWRDYSGRTGQGMSVEIVLPESTATEIERILDTDPIAMRRIVERIMKEKLLKDPSAWETPQGSGDSLRPPYEKWDAEPTGGKIYIQKEGTEPGFHEKQAQKIKNR